MQVQLLVERDQNECIVKLAGTAYKFKRNEYGHLVSEITDQEHIKWVSDPMHNASFRLYAPPKAKQVVSGDIIAGRKVIFDPVNFGVVAMGGGSEITEEATAVTEVELPVYPKKGSKRPPKRSES